MPPTIVEVNGVNGTFAAFVGDVITRHLVNFGAHTRNELAMVLDHINDGDVVVDFGAHIGTYTIPIAKKIGPSGRLLAVEGDLTTYELLCRNVGANRLDGNVKAICEIVAAGTAQPVRRVEVKGNTGGSPIPSLSNSHE